MVLLLSYGGWSLLKNQDYYSDELPHSNQIFKFARGDYSLVSYLTVIPGYHIFITTIADLLGVTVTLASLRLISVIAMVLLMLPLFYNLTNGDTLKTLQLYFWPTIHIFYFLVYTDIFSAFFVLISFYYAIQKKYTHAGILVGISLLVRQNNFFWLGFMILYLLFEEIDWKLEFQKGGVGGVFFEIVDVMWTKGKTLLLSGIGFVLFVLINGGVVLGVDKVSHPISFHLGNVWFILFSLTFLMFPVILSKTPDMFKYIKKHPKVLILLFGILLIGLGSSVNDHIYNQNDVFLKNKVLLWAYSSPVNVILYMIPVLLAVMYLMVTKLEHKNAWLMYPVTFFYLALSWMVEVRYYTIPFLLFGILRYKTDKVVEIEQLVYQILIALIMFLGIWSWKIFW